MLIRKCWFRPTGSPSTATIPTFASSNRTKTCCSITQGHVPGAVKIDWHTDLQDSLVRDYIGKDRFAELCRSKGIANDTTVVFYGDKNNWWACYAFWVFKLYGHEKCLIMNGGRKRWELDGRAVVARSRADISARPISRPRSPICRSAPSATKCSSTSTAGKPLVDVRSPGEYTGELLHMPDYPQEGALRGGHIPGAVSIPWSKAANDDGTFKSAKELEKLYCKENGLKRRGRIDRLLPHRRAIEPHLVRAQVSAGLQQREELRRLVDRMGQHGRRADRPRRRAGHSGSRRKSKPIATVTS